MNADGGGDRFDRQRRISGWDQRRLEKATVVVVGVGALGSEVAKNLALAGVGRLILCDPDTVAPSNLSRMALVGDGDVGRSKAEAVSRALRGLHPGGRAESRTADLVTGVGLGELADADVVLGCLDSRGARLRLLGRCALVDATLIDGGTEPWGGEVRLRRTADEPCYSCALPAGDRSTGDQPWSCQDLAEAGPAASSIASTALIASWMSLAALRVLLGLPVPYSLLRVDAPTGVSTPVAVRRDPDCPRHRPLGEPVGTLSVSCRATVGELLTLLEPDEEPLSWTEFVVTRACPSCGHYAEKRRINSTPLDIDDLSCHQCGCLVRPGYSQRLRMADQDARLDALGIAPEEILSVRRPEGGYAWRRLER
ncbi:ThiF family adenylyltransferase [Streptomyces spongiae]|uniref:ThiF family adenylyltransferase n=1 Tax=Streptomyces spongiae TaxID=565072 RepID=A0A5N8XG58_9ACTN|nr:ThiF family adenylyltransferase [Streptomyces spongiae]MPY58429.1 ThiF family adenylyltransferase [Streptomyces spongiae]